MIDFRQKKLHKYYFMFALSGGVVAGSIACSFYNYMWFNSALWTIASVLAVVICFVVRRKYLLVIMAAAGFIMGSNLIGNLLANNQLASKFIGAEVKIKGDVIEDIDRKDDGLYSAKILTSEISGQPLSVKLYINFKTKKSPRRSDEVQLQGKLNEGFGSFAGTIYRAKIMKVFPKGDFIRDVRDGFADGIKKIIPSPEVDLGLGYLLGQKNSLPTDLDKALRIVTLTHIVVASGYNLTILVGFSRRFFLKVSKKFSFYMASLLIFGFVFMVGLSPSMVRAGMVAFLSLVAWYFGRKTKPLFLLTFVAALTIIIAPDSVFDLGWQLSFAAFFGIMILAPLIRDYLFGKTDKLNSVISLLIETMSAQILTLPIILLNFGQVSLISILANMAVIPLVPIAMLFVFLTGISAFILPIAAKVFGLLSYVVLSFSVMIISFFSQLPGAQMGLSIDIYGFIIFYVAVLVICLYLNQRTKTDQKLYY